MNLPVQVHLKVKVAAKAKVSVVVVVVVPLSIQARARRNCLHQAMDVGGQRSGDTSPHTSVLVIARALAGVVLLAAILAARLMVPAAAAVAGLAALTAVQGVRGCCTLR